MKKLFLITVLAFVSVFVKAQSVDIVNNTTCAIKVTSLCYDEHCSVIAICDVVVVSPGNPLQVQMCSQCDNPNQRGYEICWNAAGCSNCVNIAGPGSTPCSQFPSSNVLPRCGSCTGASGGNASVFFSGPAQITVQ